MIELVKQVHDDVLAMRSELTEHVAEEPKNLAEAVEQAVAHSMARAFPDGDPDGHRRAHEAAIRAAEARAEFWSKMRYEITRYGLIGFLAWAGYAIWTAFLQGPKA